MAKLVYILGFLLTLIGHNVYAGPLSYDAFSTCFLFPSQHQVTIMDHGDEKRTNVQLPGIPLQVCVNDRKAYVLTNKSLFCYDLQKKSMLWIRDYDYYTIKSFCVVGSMFYALFDEFQALYCANLLTLSRTSSLIQPEGFVSIIPNQVTPLDFVLLGSKVYMITEDSSYVLEIEPAVKYVHFWMTLPFRPQGIFATKTTLVLVDNKGTQLYSIDPKNKTEIRTIDLGYRLHSLVVDDHYAYCIEAQNSLGGIAKNFALKPIYPRISCLDLDKGETLFCAPHSKTLPLVRVLSLTSSALLINGERTLPLLTDAFEEGIRKDLKNGHLGKYLSLSLDFSKSMFTFGDGDTILRGLYEEEHAPLIRMIRYLVIVKDVWAAQKEFEEALKGNDPYAHALAYVAHVSGVWGYTKRELYAQWHRPFADELTTRCLMTQLVGRQ